MNWTDNAVMRGLSRLCDFMLLNVLWVISSIPLFTIGASTTALYTVMLKIVRNEEGYIFKGYVSAFKENFKKSTILWLIFAVIGIIIGMDYRLAVGMSGMMRTIFQSVFLIFGFVWVCAVVYVFPLTARYENTIKNTIKNALLLCVGKLPYTLLMAVVTIGPVVITLLDTRTLMLGSAVWLIIGVSLVTWVNSHMLRKVFEIFNTDDETEEDGEDSQE